MAKELIVSVNGREKKIAIIENEQVTEFYIERGEENQGIVGNIYKGRVMRVLPGMQSAFVDIGLERDAFLYVSDFFDEEEEFERIVLDKSKKGEAEGAERIARERIELARIEREQRMEATQERAEPLVQSELAPAGKEEPGLVAVPEMKPPRPAVPTTPPPREDAEDDSRKRGRRGRRRGKGAHEAPPEASRESSVRVPPPVQMEDIATPFATPASFQRVVDEDERAAAEGEMFKDARLQERIFNQIHAVEFDIDDLPTAEVGSLLSTRTGAPESSSFQRVDDSDIASASSTSGSAYVQETVAAHVNSFIDEIAHETVSTRSFERVSDDEKATEAGLEETQTTATGKRGTRGRTKVVAAEEEAAKPRRATAARKGAAKGAAKKPAAKKAATKTASAGRKGRASQASTGDKKQPAEGDLFSASSTGAADETYEDSEVRVSSKPARGEFATRRGGRRRRRKPHEGNGAEEDRTNGKDDEAATSIASEENTAKTPIAPPPAQIAAPLSLAPSLPSPSPSAPPSGPQSRGRRERHSGGRGGQRGREQRHQPTSITDLLREGQEILVQIAKEPIAKKGARITSHIALPGRYLVYMPTVEHVGVSRKIESDSERVRLRRLIQAIRAEEDVPSGGFIVRTAGIGVTEEALREDARYLVRTWVDIRKSAEKAKAPSVAHQDLDLVERLLRDQLSDEFTAIRVDSEDEYQRIVEFVNRIQPRMVKRVKLYTRDEPILEAFGVQAEVDKAIKPRVWLKSGGYLVINQTEALVAIDVNTGKFVGRGGSRLEDTITRTNMEAVDEIVRQIRLRDLGGIIVLDLIDMEDRRNRNRVMQALQEALQGDKSPTKVLSFNDFGLVIMTRKRVKQSLERTLCAPCPYCQGGGFVKSPQTVCYEILEEARRLARGLDGEGVKQTTLRINSEVARALRSTERDVLAEIEDYLGAVDITSDPHAHQEQFDFAFI